MGGTGGNASAILDINFPGLSVPTPSSVTVNETAEGGTGGSSYSGANGNNAGTAYAESTITAATQITIQVVAQGFSGGGVLAVGGTGNTGNGGLGTASATGTVTNNSSLNILSDAIGGNAGMLGSTSTGNGGNAGNAVANAVGTGDGTGMISVTARAVCGFVGMGYGAGSVNGTGGNATATAKSLGSGGYSNATAEAVGGMFRSTADIGSASPALADAYAAGSSGSAGSTATSGAGYYAYCTVRAIANAPVISGVTSHTEAFAITSGPTRSASLANGIQSATFASLLPTSADIAAALSSSPNVRSNFGQGSSDFLGLTTLSTGNMTTGGATAYHSEVAWTFVPSDLAHPAQDLLIGLLNASSSGTGTVTFTISRQGVITTELNAASFSSADAFFTNNTLNLGAINAGVNPGYQLDLNFTLDVTPTSNGATFDPNIIFGNATMASGPAAPEPASLALLAIAGAGMLLLKRPRRFVAD